MAAPIEWASAKIGGGQSGSTTCCMMASRSVAYSEKFRTWPLLASLRPRSDRPCPRQSKVATAKPRARKSRTVSKYFSMYSARPCNSTTVPLRPGGGSKRAKRSETPSGVLTAPVTTWSGTGLAGMEMSFMTYISMGYRHAAALLRAQNDIPI